MGCRWDEHSFHTPHDRGCRDHAGYGTVGIMPEIGRLQAKCGHIAAIEYGGQPHREFTEAVAVQLWKEIGGDVAQHLTKTDLRAKRQIQRRPHFTLGKQIQSTIVPARYLL